MDGVRYEEIFITDYETTVDGLHDCLSEYANIDELNYLAALIDDMVRSELDIFEAAIAYGEHTGSLKDLINLTQNLESYNYYHEVFDEEDLGYLLVEEVDALNIPENIEPYFDYEAYGRDVSLEEGGVFTGAGYIRSTGDSFT